MLVAVVQCWGWWIATELLATKASVFDSSSTSEASAGGDSLITHNTTAEGIDEPGKSVSFRIKGGNHFRKQSPVVYNVKVEWKT